MLKLKQKIQLMLQRWQTDKRAIYWQAALLSLVIGLIVSVTIGIYPFGDKSVLTVDLYHQYTPFLMELRHKLLHGENLFMTLHVGLGINFWTVLAYYAFSPFNLLLLLFPAWLVPFAIWLIVLLKLSLAAMLMSAFLNYYYCQQASLAWAKVVKVSFDLSSYAEQIKSLQANKAIQLRFRLSLLFVSVFYAWSGYVLAYFWNLMWLDAIFALPLVALGITKLIRERKLLLYLLSLTYVISVNYYAAIFVCLFVALYSLVLFFDEWQYRKQLQSQIQLLVRANLASNADYSSDAQAGDTDYTLEVQAVEVQASDIAKTIVQQAKLNPIKYAVLDFSVLSLLAGLLSAHILYPVLANFKLSSAANDVAPKAMEWSLNFNQLLNRLLLFGEVKVRSGEPNIYVGCFVLCLVALLFYHLYKQPFALLPKLLLLLFIGLSFSNNLLNFIWHGLHYPNQLPHRFAFVFCFLLLQIAFELVWHFQWAWSKYLLVGSLWLLAICLANFKLLAQNTNMQQLFVWLNFAFALVYVLISTWLTLTVYWRKRQGRLLSWQGRGRKVAVLLLCLTLFIEVCTNAIGQVINLNNSEYLPSFHNYVQDLPEKQALSKAISQKEEPYLWRLESKNGKTIDDGALYTYNGVTLFSSTANEQVAKSMRRLGVNGNNLNSYKLQKPLNFLADFLSLKYIISETETYQDWQKVDLAQLAGAEALADKQSKWQLWQNPHVAKQAFVWPEAISEFKLSASNPYFNYNELAAKLLGENEVGKDFSLRSETSLPCLYNSLAVFSETSHLVNLTAANQEYELKAVSGDKVKKVNDTQKSFAELIYTASEDNEDISLYASCNYKLNFTGQVNDEKLQHEFGQAEIVQLPLLKRGDKLKLRFEFGENKGSAKIALAKVNQAVLAKLRAKLRSGFDWQLISSRHLKADLGKLELPKTTEANWLYTTIAYDPGWHLYVDGVEVERTSWLDISEHKKDQAGSFLAFKLPAALNSSSKLDLIFWPAKYLTGLAISLFAVIISGAYIYLVKRKRERN